MKPMHSAWKLLCSLILGVAACLAVSVPGCSGCRDRAPLGFVPKDAVAVLVFPDIFEAVNGLKDCIDPFRREEPVKMALHANRSQLVKELGFDPELPETLKARGIDPDRGLAVSLAADGKSVTIVLGVADRGALDRYLREMGTRITGGKVTFKEQTFDGVRATLLIPQYMEGYPRAAWVHMDDHVIICPAAKDGRVGQVAAQVARRRSTIEDNEVFSRLRHRIGKHQALFYVDGTSARKLVSTRTKQQLETASERMAQAIRERQETLDGFLAYLDGFAAAIHLSKRGLVLRLRAAIPRERFRRVAAILRGRGEVPDFGEFVGPDALAIGRISIDAKQLLDRVLEVIPPRLKRRLYRQLDSLEQQTKINVEKDVIPALAGRFAVALYPPTGGALPKNLSVGHPETALLAAPVVAMAQVTDAKRAAELLSTLERIMTREGLDVRTRSDGDRTIYLLGPSQDPLASWTLIDNLILVATADRLTGTVALMRKGGENVLSQIDFDRAEKLLESEEGNVLYYDISKTADAIRALDLPGEVKLILSSVTSLLYKLRDLTLDMEAEDGDLCASVNLRLR